MQRHDLIFNISAPGKYYLQLRCQRPSLILFVVESSIGMSAYYVSLRSTDNFYFLRCDTRDVTFKIISQVPISSELTRRRGMRSFGKRFRHYFSANIVPGRAAVSEIRAPGVILQAYSSASKWRKKKAQMGQDFLTGLRIRSDPDLAWVKYSQGLKWTGNRDGFAKQIGMQYEICPDDGYIFLVNVDGLSDNDRSILSLWTEEVMGDPSRECGPAWELLRSNPGIGAVCGIPDDREIDIKWKSDGRLEKLLESLGIRSGEVLGAGRPPRCMLIRKSALVGLKALNFSFDDLNNGLLNGKLLESALLPLVIKSGAITTEMPDEKSHILRYDSLDDAKFIVHRPLSSIVGEDVCLFVGLLSKFGTFSPHALRYMQALRCAGLRVFALGVATGDVASATDPGSDICDAFAARENSGYDFALWAAVLRKYPNLWEANSLLLANDSVFVADDRLPSIVDELNRSTFDVAGLTGCEMERFHLQSFFIRLNRTALRKPAVRKFWDEVVCWKDKFRIISAYEVAMTAKYESAGLRCGALFDPGRTLGGRRINTSINLWREILQHGYPFVKIQLLRDNPTNENLSGWRELLARNGFAVDEIVSQLSKEAPHAISLRVE